MKKASKTNSKLSVCYVLSYKAPNYTRTATLVNALEQLPNVELTIIKNQKTGVTRYGQTLLRLIKYRLHHKPDVFIVGFRGQEVFALFYPFMRGSHIIFDEFINLPDWFINEHKKIKEESFAARLMYAYMRWIVKKSDKVLADTVAHAQLSAELYRAPLEKFKAIPVGAEEEVFYPRTDVVPASHQRFEVFFYGNMLPLHGLAVILDAIKELAGGKYIKNMHFTLIGGHSKPMMMSQLHSFVVDNGLELYVTHLPWVDYKKLPEYIAAADVCLGGPFGSTGQARRVITGKTFQFLAMSKPTIIGETENGSLFEDRVNCLIARQGDARNLADKLTWAYEHKDKLPAIGSNGLTLYKENFSSHRISQQLEGLLASLVKPEQLHK